MAVVTKRVYASPGSSDGTRILVDRLWPRGMRKDALALDDWLRDLAPSNELRKWFHSQPEEWLQFRKRYLKELSRPELDRDLQTLYSLAHGRRRLTLLYASKNDQHNNATVLKDLLEGMRKPPSAVGPGVLRSSSARKAPTRRR